MRKRPRIKRSQSLQERLRAFARDAREKAEAAPPGPAKDELLTRVSQAEDAMAFDDWAKSNPVAPTAPNYAARAKKYRDKAEECRQLATYALLPSTKDTYLSMASNYERLAEGMDRLASVDRPSNLKLG